MNLSKIFKISGGLRSIVGSPVVISDPDLNSVGEIVLDEDFSTFYGYWIKKYEKDERTVFEKRYLTGAIAPNGRNGNNGIAFYELPNDNKITQIMYVAPDLKNPKCGEWATPGKYGYFEPRGRAKIVLEEQPYSEEDDERISIIFEEVDVSNINNVELLCQVESCIDVLANAT